MRRFLFPILLSLSLLAACGRDQPSATARPIADFVLQTAAGPLDSRSLRGKVLLVFFGYTHCPDVCPASMAAGAQALTALSASERANTRMIMISVDPERDTPQRLKEYTAYFHPEMIGATGTPAEIERVARAYGAGYRKQAAAADGSYGVDHTSNTYLIGPDGRLVATLALGTPTADIARAIRRLLP